MESRRKEILKSYLSESDSVALEESEDSLMFLWAVSYSDLLMVLMSFFIVYFSFTGSDGKSLMDEITAKFKQSGSIASENTELKPTQTDSKLLSEIQTRLNIDNKSEKDINGVSAIRIDLEDNVFNLGEYTLNGDITQRIDELLYQIEPFKERITLTFIGHADQIPIRILRRDRALATNMNLSSLRAGSAVSYAISQGFDPKAIWIEGFAEFGRNTRSLSIRVKERVRE